MKLKSEVVGMGLTALYLLLVAGMVYWKWDTLPKLGLNELGDFLAGVFGPVAFLWLILGYLQQGRELRLSSEALQLQASELKRSVEQQAHLVSLGKEQIAAQTDALNEARRQYEQSMNAYFAFVPHDYIVSGEQVSNKFEIINLGADALDIRLFSSLPEASHQITIEVLRGGETKFIELKFDLLSEDCHGSFFCFYDTRDGRAISFKMDLFLSAETRMATITPRVKLEDL